ncbi:MAG: hypothetical protein AAFV95_22285 [Bacteroidota bacterium]
MFKCHNGLIAIVACLLLVTSCQVDYDKALPQEKYFFDLKAFFQGEKQRLKQIPAFVKTTTINQQSETHELDNLSLDEELQIFENSDINRVSWLDKYEVDSLLTDGTLTSIHYKALTPKLKTQDIQIRYDNQQVSEIQIQNFSSSNILSASQKLIYRPASGYSIQSLQKMLLSEEKEIMVEVEFRR